MGINNHELMDFKKFVQSRKKLMYHEDTIFLSGCFKEGKSSKLFRGDNFEAHIVNESGKSQDINLIYKTYLEWFNYTRNDNEKERIFVLVKLGEKNNG